MNTSTLPILIGGAAVAALLLWSLKKEAPEEVPPEEFPELGGKLSNWAINFG